MNIYDLMPKVDDLMPKGDSVEGCVIEVSIFFSKGPATYIRKIMYNMNCVTLVCDQGR